MRRSWTWSSWPSASSATSSEPLRSRRGPHLDLVVDGSASSAAMPSPGAADAVRLAAVGQRLVRAVARRPAISAARPRRRRGCGRWRPIRSAGTSASSAPPISVSSRSASRPSVELRLLVHPRDRRAREDVVELVQQHVLPGVSSSVATPSVGAPACAHHSSASRSSRSRAGCRASCRSGWCTCRGASRSTARPTHTGAGRRRVRSRPRPPRRTGRPCRARPAASRRGRPAAAPVRPSLGSVRRRRCRSRTA